MRRLIVATLFGAAVLPAQHIPVCVSTFLSTENPAVQQNQRFIQDLAPVFVDDVFRANGKGYYKFETEDKQRLDCTRVIFIFNKADKQDWAVRARIGRVGTSYDDAINTGKVIMNSCNLGLRENQVETPFEWKKAVQDKVSTCFDENMRSKDKEKILRETGFVARNVEDHCYQDVATPGCLVLPLPFERPFDRLAKSRFRIVYPVENGPEQDVEVSAGGQCAKYSDKAIRDLQGMQAELQALRTVMPPKSGNANLDAAWQALETADSMITESLADPSKRNPIPSTVDKLLSKLPGAGLANEKVPPGITKYANRLKADLAIKPIEKALVVSVGKDLLDKTKGAEWSFGRVEVVSVDDDVLTECSLLKNPDAGTIPFKAPAGNTTPGGQR